MEKSVAPKRQREEVLPLEKEDALIGCDELVESSKRHKPYNHILSLLESDEDDSSQDLSPLITALQQEITNSASDSDTLLSQHNITTTTTTNSILEDCSSPTTQCSFDKDMVMTHLLQASDDELGIPNKGDNGSLDLGDDYGFNAGGDMFSSICDGLTLWEFEDETANYYDLLQSQLFL